MKDKKKGTFRPWIYIGAAGVPGGLAVLFGICAIFAVRRGFAAAGILLWIWLGLSVLAAVCAVCAAVRLSRHPALREAQREAAEAGQKLFQLRLLRGEIVGEEEWKACEEELLPERKRYYALAVLSLCPERSGSEAWDEDTGRVDAACRRLAAEMPERMKEQLWLPPVCAAGGTVALIFTGEEEGELQERINAFYGEAASFAGQLWSPGIRMGISAVHADRRHIREAFQESVRALTLPWAETGAGTVGCRFYSIDAGTSEGAYDFRYGQEIQRGLKGIDRILCSQALDGFESFLKRTAGKEEEIIYILQFVSAILSVALETGLDLHSLCPGGLIALCDDLLWMPEPGRVRHIIEKRMVDTVLRMRSDLLERGARSMMEEIERLIRERQGNITLTECASALQVHPSYIWKLLKAEKGKSFSDYLEQYKLEEAKRLLLETDLTVAQIAARLNYTNAQNFIRFFSKSTGTTPGKFRKQE